MDDLLNVLRNVELFDGLIDDELAKVASICQERRLRRGEMILKQGEEGDEMFIVTEGFVEVVLGESQATPARRVVVNLGAGQITGEMALLDQGARSATVRSVSEPTVVQVIRREAFDELC